jgi:hypothetical protein
MKANVGHKLDIAWRIVGGISLLSLIFVWESELRWLGLLGIALLATVTFRWCPMWALLGINTGKKA